jgi:hypothetical protein
MKELERRAGMQLESATLSDLLIPSFLHTSDTLYDIDIVHRVLEQFLVQVGILLLNQILAPLLSLLLLCLLNNTIRLLLSLS